MSGDSKVGTPEIAALANGLDIQGSFVEARPYGSGHINGTWRLAFQTPHGIRHVILQRINGHIFKEPAALMENIERVTAHLAVKVAAHADRGRLVLRLLPARDGRMYQVDPGGEWWRAYAYIEGARSYEAAESPAQAYQVAYAFGRFQQMLVDLPAPRLHETIPDFHHTPKRFAALERAIAADASNRASLARSEIEFAVRRQSLASVLLDEGLPERITHNDTKLNNVMLDDATGEALCVIDLDTVMHGIALHDFGDMVRTTVSPSAEDEIDQNQVTVRLPVFESLVRGYLAATEGFLTAAERTLLVASAKVITFEQGIRFLADHLAGDTYYKVHRADHNLHRCRTQFRLLALLEEHQEAMERLVRSVRI